MAKKGDELQRNGPQCLCEIFFFFFFLYLTPPMTGFPVEFGIGVRGPKCLNATRWSKKFSDRFSRFDTIPAVTDSHPASHPAMSP